MANLSTLMGSKTKKTQVFTSAGYWTRPEGVDSVEVLLIGGGGGGGGVATNSTYTAAAGGGGGGGQVVRRHIDVTSTQVGNNINVTIGAGGSGGDGTQPNTSAIDGTNGGFTTFGVYLTANGGGGGGGGDYVSSRFGLGFATGGGQGIRSSGTWAQYVAGGGGGGAGGDAPTISQTANGEFPTNKNASGKYGGDGAMAFYYVSSDTLYINMNSGGLGIDGYGGGGGGGVGNITVASIVRGEGKDGGGVGAGPTSTTAVNGNNGIAGKGGGGGGAGTYGASTNANGGNGGSGLCVVTWYE